MFNNKKSTSKKYEEIQQAENNNSKILFKIHRSLSLIYLLYIQLL